MTLSDNQRAQIVAVRLGNAADALHDAMQLADSGSLRGALNRAYYAMFHAVSALAIARGMVVKKHASLISWFQKEFVKAGPMDRLHGRALQKAFDDRSDADYEDFMQVTQEQMATRVTEAEAFIRAVKDMLRSTEALHDSFDAS